MDKAKTTTTSTAGASSEYRGLNGQSTDNEDEDYPPQFTTLATELEKCKFCLTHSSNGINFIMIFKN